MDKVIENLKKIIEFSINKLKECTFSIDNTNCLKDPFLRPDIDTVAVDELIYKSNKNNQKILELSEKINFSPKLLYMYILLDSDTREFTYHNFTFFSIREIEKRLIVYEEDNQNNICDIASCYHGLGWIIVLTLNRKDGKFFLRMDGGSNNYDREDNWNFIKNYDSHTQQDKLFNIDKLFDILKTKNINNLNSLLIN